MQRSLVLCAALLALATPLAGHAQAGPYPALQPSQVASREYNFALADFTGGTAFVFQWREGLDNPRFQFTADVGLADRPGFSAVLLGGGLHYQLTRTSPDMPFDMVLGGGIGLMAGDGRRTFRIPFGVVVGHRFPLEGGFAITPFVHPRLSMDRSSGGGGSASETNLDIDVGGNFEINRQMQLRMAATLGGTECGWDFVCLGGTRVTAVRD